MTHNQNKTPISSDWSIAIFALKVYAVICMGVLISVYLSINIM